MLSYKTLYHTVQSGDACNGVSLPYAVVYYTWTDNQSGATQDSFAVEWKTPDGMVGGPYGYAVQLDQNPGIAFSGQNIAGTSVPVMAGQQIALTGSPAPASVPSEPWAITGSPLNSNNPVSGFTFTPGNDPERPTSGQIVPLNLTVDQGSQAFPTVFYFTIPGTYTVTYSASPGGATVSADFIVSAPTISFDTGNPGTIQDAITYDKNGNAEYSLTCGLSGNHPHCINFSAAPSTSAGIFKWVQTIQRDTAQAKLPGSSKLLTCKTPPGLDSFYPLNHHINIIKCAQGFTCVGDSPSSGLSGYRFFARNFYATMYLMWNSGVANSIDVPFGSVDWNWNASTQLKDGDWTQPQNKSPAIGSFEPSSGFPTWTRVLINGKDCVPQ